MIDDGLAPVVVTGPLARYEAAFRAHLVESGYAPRSARDLVRAMGRVSCWLEERGLAASELRPPVAADLVTMVADAGPVIRFLREIGGVPAGGGAAGAGPVEALLAQFRRWLAGERGLSAATVSCYGKQARKFLVLLARLGLRGAEAALRLADIDWHAGEAAVRGKGNRAERLPLPAEAREAIADYLTPGRPACAAATGSARCAPLTGS